MATATENGTAPAINEKTAAQNGDVVTVFHDPENFNVKHPLMNEWTLWFTKPPSGKVRYARYHTTFKQWLTVL
jgi:translation initiation factor 4E